MNKFLSVVGILVLFFIPNLYAQTYVQAWGNIEGIRVEGQLFPVGSSLCLVYNDWQDVVRTAKEKQRPDYTRQDQTQITTTLLDSMDVVQRITDTGKGKARLELEFSSRIDTTMTGAFLRLGTAGYTKLVMGKKTVALDPAKIKKELTSVKAKNLQLEADDKKLGINLAKPTEIILHKSQIDSKDSLHVYLAVMTGDVKQGQSAAARMDVQVSGDIDHTPVNLALDIAHPGRQYDGFGGNFRLQNMLTDPTVISYNLENMRVAWGRVEMPWWFWQPEEENDPIAAAESGEISPFVYNALVMARSLKAHGMRIIVSAWFPPAWAIEGEMTWRRPPGAPRGNPLNPEKMDQICKSIADYLVYLKNAYGVEAYAFSFNESDLGINVRQTAEEHRSLIRTLGPYLAKRGLKTKIMLGDNSDATTTDFILPALNDPECLPYIAGVSFHSWRGWSDELLNFWRDASVKLNVPMIIGEGSTDAAAHSYPAMFLEDIFALDEINLYARLMSICQPKSVVQWQLTSDYSILTGAGIYKTEGPLETTRRFWNMKQLAATPNDAFHLPVTSDNPIVNSCALGNIATGDYVVHMVNNGAERTVNLTGLPQGMTELTIYVTDADKQMAKGAPIQVVDGAAEFILAPAGFTSVFGNVELNNDFRELPRRFWGRRRANNNNDENKDD